MVWGCGLRIYDWSWKRDDNNFKSVWPPIFFIFMFSTGNQSTISWYEQLATTKTSTGRLLFVLYIIQVDELTILKEDIRPEKVN